MHRSRPGRRSLLLFELRPSLGGGGEGRQRGMIPYGSVYF